MYCLMTVALLVVTSTIIFGLETWTAMFSSTMSGYAKIHDGDLSLLNKMSTIVALFTALGAGEYKLFAQLPFLVLCAGTMVWLVQRNVNEDLLVAFAIVSSFLIALHNMVYDQTILVVPMLLALSAGSPVRNWAHAIIWGTFLFPYWAVISDPLNYFPFGALVVSAFWTCVVVLAVRSTKGFVKPATDSLSSSPSGRPTICQFPGVLERQGQ